MHNIILALAALAVPIDSIYCDPANARTGHDLDGIAASLKKYGQRTPVVANKDGVILKGNGTYTAAKTRLGWTEIAAVVVDDDSVTATGYAIADNRLGDLSHFDDSALKALLASLDEPLDVPGIDAEFFASLDGLRGDFGGDESASDFPALADGDRQPFQQKTFTLHDEQAQIVDDAITLARTNPLVDTGLNENSNGNALALICQQWLEAQNGDG